MVKPYAGGQKCIFAMHMVATCSNSIFQPRANLVCTRNVLYKTSEKSLSPHALLARAMLMWHMEKMHEGMRCVVRTCSQLWQGLSFPSKSRGCVCSQRRYCSDGAQLSCLPTQSSRSGEKVLRTLKVSLANHSVQPVDRFHL